MNGYRLEAAFREAVALDDFARRGLIDRLSRENPSLAREVRELLDADARAEARGLFDRPAAVDLASIDARRETAAGSDEAEPALAAPAEDRVEGRQIGGYRI